MFNTIRHLLVKNKDLIDDPEIELVVFEISNEMEFKAAVIAAEFKWYHGQKHPRTLALHREDVWWLSEYHTEGAENCLARTQKILADNQQSYQQKAREAVAEFIEQRRRWKNNDFKKLTEDSSEERIIFNLHET